MTILHRFRLGAALAILLAPAVVHAQMRVVPLPLSGPAYALAQDAYRASARGDYRHAEAQLREAIRLRPDVAALREQLQKIRQEQTRSRDKPSTVRDAGYRDANAAFTAYGRKDYRNAVRLARDAADKAPDNTAYWLLLGNALIADDRYEDADRSLDEGAGKVVGNTTLRQRRDEVRRELAARAAAKAFNARRNDDGAGELAAIRDAVGYAPSNLSYRLMLIVALLRGEQWDEAIVAASDAHAREATQAAPLLLRGYAYQRLGKDAAANEDFSSAATLAGNDERDNVQRFISDTQKSRTTLARNLPTPELDCSNPAACRVLAGQPPRDRGYDEATLAYQALDSKDYVAASMHARKAIAAAPQNRDYRVLLLDALTDANDFAAAEQAANDALAQGQGQDAVLLAQRGAIRERLGKAAAAREDYAEALALGGLPPTMQIDLLAHLNRRTEARKVFDEARRSGALDQLSPLELAYLASSAGDDAAAHAAFSEADRSGKLPDQALDDAAFAATRAHDDRSALAYFKRSIDAANDTNPANKSAQQQFDTRRAVSTIDREFGFIASLTRSGGGPSAGSAAAAGAQPGASGNNGSLQAGAEAYWRPFGYRNGSTVEIFGRVFQTLQDKSRGATGTQTAQATVGARWKPWSSQNVVVSFGRLIPIGSQASSDWLAQLAYSDGIGTDLRVDRLSWWTTQWYAEAGHYLQHPQTYGLASLQAGRSFRLDGVDPRLVVFPHLTLNTDYNSLNQQRSATGIGPGVNLRYWFREDAYHAPRSYVEVSLQYRMKISGDERARGFFMTTTLSY
ncbi:tetratricopeptide repeat protein [Herbaspirillum sp. NPDC101397]|uniref:NfrA family protein n=1 Tax=Herbaspirillum sp. NPDC101397 TaxID=3364006 RepID=UPI00383A7481